MRRLLLAALLAAGCGTGTDGKPVAPPTSPAPVPQPPPTLRAVAQILSEPSGLEGYYGGEVIVVLVDFDSRTNVTVEGSPGSASRSASESGWPTSCRGPTGPGPAGGSGSGTRSASTIWMRMASPSRPPPSTSPTERS